MMGRCTRLSSWCAAGWWRSPASSEDEVTMQALANSAWLLLTDPNVAFTFLVLGLWATVLAVAVPGTGAPEAGAVILLALAAVGLLNLPTSLVGLALMALAMGLFIAEVHWPAHGALLVAGAISMGVGGLL